MRYASNVTVDLTIDDESNSNEPIQNWFESTIYSIFVDWIAKPQPISMSNHLKIREINWRMAPLNTNDETKE